LDKGPDGPYSTEGEKGRTRARRGYPSLVLSPPDHTGGDSVDLSSCCSAPSATLSLVADLCHYDAMAKTVIVKLTDDIDGSDADETVQFALDGRSYEIDVNSANAARLREALGPFIEKARAQGAQGGPRVARSPRSTSAERSLYSQLNDDEKARFRSWANMPTARRISDARVKSWIAAGRP
jgi:Lsr2